MRDKTIEINPLWVADMDPEISDNRHGGPRIDGWNQVTGEVLGFGKGAWAKAKVPWITNNTLETKVLIGTGPLPDDANLVDNNVWEIARLEASFEVLSKVAAAMNDPRLLEMLPQLAAGIVFRAVEHRDMLESEGYGPAEIAVAVDELLEFGENFDGWILSIDAESGGWDWTLWRSNHEVVTGEIDPGIWPDAGLPTYHELMSAITEV